MDRLLTRRITRTAAMAACAVSLVVGAAHAVADTPNPTSLVSLATKAVEKFRSSKLSDDVYQAVKKSKAVLIIPNYQRAGLGIGGEGGKGVVLKKLGDGQAWSYPAFFELEGATLGAQAGFEKGALMITIYDDQTLNELMDGELSFGAEARAVAGSQGAQIDKSGTGRHKIGVFLLTEGAFAGAIVKGGEIRPIGKLNEAYYGRNAKPQAILKTDGLKNPGADKLRAVLSALESAPAAAPMNRS